MAKTTKRSAASDAPIGTLLVGREPMPAEREMLIAIYPRAYSQWTGSSSQLKAEGLIPADFKWPECRGSSRWSTDGFDYWVQRCRPAGMKGSMRQWTRGDYWFLRRELAACKGDWTEADIYEKQCALAKVLWRQTPAADAQSNRSWKAHEDKKFQAFKALLTAAPA